MVKTYVHQEKLKQSFESLLCVSERRRRKREKPDGSLECKLQRLEKKKKK